MGPCGTVESSTLWKRIATAETSIDELCDLIGDAHVAYQQSLVVCSHCGRRVPEEDTVTEDRHKSCHPRASFHHGVVS